MYKVKLIYDYYNEKGEYREVEFCVGRVNKEEILARYEDAERISVMNLKTLKTTYLKGW